MGFLAVLGFTILGGQGFTGGVQHVGQPRYVAAL